MSKAIHIRIGLLFSISCLGFFTSVLSQSLAAEDYGDRPQYGAIEVSDQDTDNSLAQVAPTPKTTPVPDSTTKQQPTKPPSTGALRGRQAQPSPELLASTYGGRTDSRGRQRLAGTPNMFGDLFYDLGGSVFVRDSAANTALADLPLAAASRRVKIAENNKALPEDRVFFMYNHFENALHNESNLGPTFVSRDLEVDRYTFGLEKTLFDENWSVELRMPLGRAQ